MRLWPLLTAIAAVVICPIWLRPKTSMLEGQDTVVVITPHNEAIRAEFRRGFRDWYRERTGRTITVDFRTPGGTSEIGRYLGSAYYAGFEKYWTDLGKSWTTEIQSSWSDSKTKPSPSPFQDSPAQAARRTFLDSNISSGIDVFFGGGAYDFHKAAGQGFLVDCGYAKAHPELFGTAIPQTLGGEPYFDPAGRWLGSALSAFGITYNRDQLSRLGLPEPRAWPDLSDPRYFGTLALANPTQSSSANKAFEMLIQQQIQEEMRANPASETAGVAAGWTRAMQLLQKIAGNARYFSDSSSKISIDVETGEAAAGMTIDFYGRIQSESVRLPDGSSRIGYVDAEGGTSYGADPIGLLRGAPHREAALAFIEYVMGPGQKLWNWKVGTPEGPEHYALRRLPILPDLYKPEYRALRSDPDVAPYEAAKSFTYVDARTGRLFDTFAFIIRVMCIDCHPELKDAWHELITARARLGQFPPEAMKAFGNVSAVGYDTANGRIREIMASADKLQQVQLAKELADQFRANYERAADLARKSQ